MPDTPVAVVVKRDDGMTRSTDATTPPDVPNLYVKALSPLLILCVRTLRAFLQSLVGMLTTTGLVSATGVGSSMIVVHDFWSALRVAVMVSVCVALVAFLQNLYELITKIDESLPAWRA